VGPGDGKKNSEEGFSTLNEALFAYGENRPDGDLPLSVFELPEPSPPTASPEVSVVEKMHPEAQILGRQRIATSSAQGKKNL